MKTQNNTRYKCKAYYVVCFSFSTTVRFCQCLIHNRLFRFERRKRRFTDATWLHREKKERMEDISV